MKPRTKNASIAAAIALTAAGGIVTGATAHAAGFAQVTNGNDAGPGSLREALEVQQASHVLIETSVRTIDVISGALDYASQAPLVIHGSGQTIRTTEDMTLLTISQGADINLSNLNFEGPGGFSILNQATAGGKGIFVDVREDQEGTVKVVLKDVSVLGVANHGIHVSDCDLADTCGGGGGGAGDGSAASISLVLDRVTVDDVGNGKFDADGVRVDERGEGGIYFLADRSTFINVGADGVELDEGDDGNVVAQITESNFLDNGAYCDPAILEPYVNEGEFAESEGVEESDPRIALIGGPSPDDGCFELEVDTYDSGFVEAFEFGIDLDDGIDIDEAAEGSVNVTMTRSTIRGNLDEGVDFDEEGDGDVSVSFIDSVATKNRDDGFKVSEEGAGDVFGSLYLVKSRENGGKGAVFEEEDAGDLIVTVVRTKTMKNDDGDDTGIEAAQEDGGGDTGALYVTDSNIADGIDTDGVTLNP